MHDGSWTWRWETCSLCIGRYPQDCSHIVGSFAKVLCDLVDSPMSSSRHFFHGVGRSPLYRVVLHGSDIYLQGLRVAPIEPIPTILLPYFLHIQFDNYWKNNKCRFIKTFWSLLTAKGIFIEVHVSYLLVGHTYDDISAIFGKWSMDMRKYNYPNISFLMKLYMDKKNILVIPHMMEKLPDWRTFVSEHIPSDNDKLIKHMNA